LKSPNNLAKSPRYRVQIQDPSQTGFSSTDLLGTVLQNCVIEEGVLDETPNDTVVFGPAASFFEDWDARNLVPDIHGPLFNKGATVDAPDTDIAGSPRVLHSCIDIGAYESTKTPGFYTILR
ncbi:MAG: choice-of-anchor Q domain-containing protein, partial [Kiritimatiellia bacterium]